ncbi:MAG TPA: hypothetical protein VLE93_01695 [Candidatus Saccharimonadales bacterium]|nr:hypothetical protein [Candidatus Saccharimonadales bacterium]
MAKEVNKTVRFDIELPFDDASLEDVAYRAYQDLFSQLKRKDLHPLRFWNFVPDINKGADEHGEGDQERYKLFNRGRRKAWLEYDPSLNAICASTCVGSHEQDIFKVSCLGTIYPVIQLENPNQISFLDYSEKYGTPPSSRRGSLHITPEGIEVWISGTASITGEDNRFAGDKEPKDLAKQLQQTLENIETLISDANLSKHYPEWQPRNLTLKELENVKVYVRNPEDIHTVHEKVEAAGIPEDETEYMEADVCRKPLDVEIEAMIPATRTSQ